MMNEPLKAFTLKCQERVEQALDRLLPSPTTRPTRLHEAMRYATLNGGKRIRPMLVYGAGQALDIAWERLDAPASAVELIHAYSLVHDDLPAMDDDDLRRNQPTCHRAYDEATAILVGDALQSLAFKSLCCDPCMQADAEIRLTMVEALARASGSRGMAGGQALDLQAVGRELNLAELENLHIHKTGALIRVAVRMGALLDPNADKEQTHRLDHYAKCIGLAFQIQDDILDIEGDTETLGKTKGKDLAQEKPTYPSLLGLTGAKEKASLLIEEAIQSLDSFQDEADPLRWIARYITDRSH
ncbi:MAG: (2E,6E)-farnesyl diphosphate synthase [gamma proteobacterium symbiont of Ctena orbiculata]|uniref:(2E,6E)-farnesyl diphosphate synthase n=1 Tax=Candidatus Thiodiazotropha taylori TaxID=2792791 RepID=A0A944M7K3_9GAMM|nr:(2E,6E)-farnesyl diphosphate synthase [Candidatus Thiodiazotropha taylori]PUB87487.1 MAG: (2E,6E)-farnesyl diphosphate synthase [gamma proteobacterium symbiont of Ctena orbiculata]MBT2988618.1 (2E,6E)-farnesyl diphosphate synthase [Candidatus Thiodiazotropha taylori]MBT2996813.1 (2E,6E)-farnesyl diphosphate synthase [Candidatus Thiodiazotropha taylori]MBT3002046.1 (2E,6E)-farnesyl diphosphate synthase [Candidatus Thiodiazotropha taylori]